MKNNKNLTLGSYSSDTTSYSNYLMYKVSIIFAAVLHENPILSNPLGSENSEPNNEVKNSPVKMRNKSKRLVDVSNTILSNTVPH